MNAKQAIEAAKPNELGIRRATARVEYDDIAGHQIKELYIAVDAKGRFYATESGMTEREAQEADWRPLEP